MNIFSEEELLGIGVPSLQGMPNSLSASENSSSNLSITDHSSQVERLPLVTRVSSAEKKLPQFRAHELLAGSTQKAQRPKERETKSYEVDKPTDSTVEKILHQASQMKVSTSNIAINDARYSAAKTTIAPSKFTKTIIDLSLSSSPDSVGKRCRSPDLDDVKTKKINLQVSPSARKRQGKAISLDSDSDDESLPSSPNHGAPDVSLLENTYKEFTAMVIDDADPNIRKGKFIRFCQHRVNFLPSRR